MINFKAAMRIAPRMRAQRVVRLLVAGSALLAFMTPTSMAHNAPDPLSAYERMFHDCADDYGFHANRNTQKGHDIVALDAREMDVAGTPRFVVYVILGKDQVGGNIPRKEAVSFQIGSRTISTTIQSSDDTSWTVTSGTQVTISKGQVEIPADEGGGDDPNRFSLALGFPYSALQAQNGDRATNFRVQGYVTVPPSAEQRADYAPGGSFDPVQGDIPSCNPNTDTAYFVDTDGYLFRNVPAAPPPPPANTAPVAEFTFTPTSPRAGDTVTFTDASTDAEGPITSRSWTFGDGAASSAANPTHAYASQGQYTVALQVTDAGDLTATKVTTITVSAPPAAPTANFTNEPATPRAGRQVNFTDTSTQGSAPLSAWTWSFGDNSTSTTRHPNHTFSQPGTYNVTLRVRNADGMDAATSRTITVLPERVLRANFTINTTFLRAGLAINFTDTSTPGETTITTRSWTFGDGETATTTNASHTYAQAGNYTVRLSIMDSAGATNSTSRTITIHPPESIPAPTPLFTYAPTRPFAGEDVSFTDASEAPESSLVAWAWSFGDGATSAQPNPTHAYASPGQYTVTLNVTSANGKTAEQSLTLTVGAANAVPIAAFSLPTIILEGTPLSLVDQSTDPDSTIATRAWDMGDGTSSTNASPTHTYARAGTYTVTLTVTDDAGATNTTTRQITVDPATMTARIIAPPTAHAGDPVTLTDASTSNSDIATRAWSFGDGETATTQNATHTYEEPGTFTITLTATNAQGRTNTTSTTIVILPPRASPPTSNDPTPATETTPADASKGPSVEPGEARNEAPLGGALGAILALSMVALARRRA